MLAKPEKPITLRSALDRLAVAELSLHEATKGRSYALTLLGEACRRQREAKGMSLRHVADRLGPAPSLRPLPAPVQKGLRPLRAVRARLIRVPRIRSEPLTPNESPMKTDPSLLPAGVADSWFHISCGGESWVSRVCLGRNLLKVLDELAPNAEAYAEDLNNADAWYEINGQFVHIALPCGEDPDIQIALIDDPAFTALAEHALSLRKLLVGFVQLTDHEAKDGGWRVTLEYDNHNDGARVLDGDGNLIAKCYEDMGESGDGEGPDRQCIEAMRRAANGIKP